MDTLEDFIFGNAFKDAVKQAVQEAVAEANALALPKAYDPDFHARKAPSHSQESKR